MGQAAGIVDEYLGLKRDIDADLLAMQVGDFYEFFANDAKIVGDELGLNVSEKSSHGSNYPMAGVPVTDLSSYLKELVDKGYRVGIADQRTDSETHEREITRIVTPGTLVESTTVDARYLGTITLTEGEYGVAFADVTTGSFRTTSLDTLDDVLTECYRFDPVELVLDETIQDEQRFVERINNEFTSTITRVSADLFSRGGTRHAVRDQFGAGVIQSLDLSDASILAVGGILLYLDKINEGIRTAMTRLQPYQADTHVRLDATTQRNLELTEPLVRESGNSVLGVIDHTMTSGGGRLLKSWLGRPQTDAELITYRQSCVESLVEASLGRDAIREILSSVGDLERLASRVIQGNATPRDLKMVQETIDQYAKIRDRIISTDGLADSRLLETIQTVDYETAQELSARISTAIVADPPSSISNGGIFKEGYNDELDAVITQHQELLDWVVTLESREKRRHNITHLQVDRNRTDGYYIQIGKSEVDKVPDSYEEIKTLKNSKRFTTSELRDHENEILRIEPRRAEIETTLFETLRSRIADQAELLWEMGERLAEIDVLASFATHAVNNGWVKPAIGGDGLTINNGRHPVVEQTTEFVPNDVELTHIRRFLLVTGPNMSGKSTYLRQTALIVLLAQIGSYVPAEHAQIEPVDAIFTRVGALDELAQGRSTFMVEMQELSNILHSANKNSLVILDEVGRGTATYDGISIAWAATEYLHNNLDAFSLFATHYHELTELASHLDRSANVHVAAEENNGEVTFLYRIHDGPTDKSYGIHVANLAGVPEPVVKRASIILDKLQNDKAIDVYDESSGQHQVVFDLESGELKAADTDPDTTQSDDSSSESQVIDELNALELQHITPAELYELVESWKHQIRHS